MTSGPIDHLLGEALRSSDIAWGIGCHGTLAEFMRDPGEQCHIETMNGWMTLTTARGGVRLAALPEIRPVEFSGKAQREIALCLPLAIAGGSARTALAELGPDRDALRDEHRDHLLFDLGIGAPQIEACVRTADPVLIDMLRRHAGRSLLEPGNSVVAAIVAASPHRIYRSSLGRIEVHQPIPAPGGRTPLGPHTHFNPHALRHRRPYPPRNPIPPGWLPCASLYFANAESERH